MKKEVWPNTKERTWKPRERVPPAGFPPNQGLLVAVKDFPELGVTSAFQKVTLVRARFVSNSNSKEDVEAATGRLNFAPKAPHQLSLLSPPPSSG